MSFADDIKDIAGRIKDSGNEYRMLINNERSQVEDLINFRSQVGEADDKTDELYSALDALQMAYQAANDHFSTTEEVLQKLLAVLGNG